MSEILPIIISSIAGLSTVIGGLIVFIKLRDKESFICISLSFSMTIMILISVFELFPTSSITLIRWIGMEKGIVVSFITLVISILVIKILNKFIKTDNNLYKIGLLNMICLMFHNFPEGIATYMASYKDIILGIKLSLAIMLHNIPEGISISVPIYYSTGSKKRGVVYSFISGISEPIGAIITYILFREHINDLTLSIVLVFVSGIMLSISINEILPEVLKYNKKDNIFIGIILGIILYIISNLI